MALAGGSPGLVQPEPRRPAEAGRITFVRADAYVGFSGGAEASEGGWRLPYGFGEELMREPDGRNLESAVTSICEWPANLPRMDLWLKFIEWETAVHLGDLASVLGLLISLAGFSTTILAVYSSRNAARRAEEAARAAVLRIRVFDKLMDFTFAIVTLEEIKRFHRIQQWALLPDRYASLRRTLIAIRSSSLELTAAQRQTVQSALTTLRSIERAVERGIPDPSSLDGAKFNNLLAERADGLAATLYELKMLHTDVRDGKA